MKDEVSTKEIPYMKNLLFFLKSSEFVLYNIPEN